MAGDQEREAAPLICTKLQMDDLIEKKDNPRIDPFVWEQDSTPELELLDAI